MARKSLDFMGLLRRISTLLEHISLGCHQPNQQCKVVKLQVHIKFDYDKAGNEQNRERGVKIGTQHEVAFCIHGSLSGIGVPHGVLGDIWVHLKLKRGDKGDHWTSSAWERPHRSDTVKSL
ncbi:hypothetical protein DY000_02059877 [Brassica cretica]|uniref:Uncharacterized protein n=1 Tax=Brassica cretica TaxID=69181 RepID=A0ABQ7B355_BRACR|nr:hypothetical protein DY000_02059877 [Brassica cretica]